VFVLALVVVVVLVFGVWFGLVEGRQTQRH
jgi:hypothetical protein